MSSDNSTRVQPPKSHSASPSLVTRSCNRCHKSMLMRGGGFGHVPGRGRVWLGACCLTTNPVGAADQRRLMEKLDMNTTEKLRELAKDCLASPGDPAMIAPMLKTAAVLDDAEMARVAGGPDDCQRERAADRAHEPVRLQRVNVGAPDPI